MEHFLSAFNNSQLLLVNLLDEYYEEKIGKQNHRISDLYDDIIDLQSENEGLKNHIIILRETIKTLKSKFCSANNMVRILSKTMETEQCCQSASLNSFQIDDLVHKNLDKIQTVDKEIIALHNSKDDSIYVIKRNSQKKVIINKARKSNKKFQPIREKNRSVQRSNNMILTSKDLVSDLKSKESLENIEKSSVNVEHAVFPELKSAKKRAMEHVNDEEKIKKKRNLNDQTYIIG